MMQVHQAARLAMHNKTQLDNTSKCGCYHCFAIFTPQEIKEWTDDGDTAICPFCFVDAVLPETSDFPLNKQFLEKLHAYWF